MVTQKTTFMPGCASDAHPPMLTSSTRPKTSSLDMTNMYALLPLPRVYHPMGNALAVVAPPHLHPIFRCAEALCRCCFSKVIAYARKRIASWGV